jgi:4-amino-4-deoxy-L-arabinose transferase-like glycosyltransferase
LRDERAGALLLALGVALAFLSKGLVALLIPGAAALLYMLRARDWPLLWRSRPWWTVLALAVLAVPWLLLVEHRNPGFLQFFFMHEQFERFLTRVHERYEPDWYFIPVLLAGFMPWTVLLPAIAERSWRAVRQGSGPDLLLALWAVFCFVFFSLSQSKLAPYILPLFPALALLAGVTVADMEGRRLRRSMWIAAALWGAVAVAAVLLTGRLYARHPELASGPGVPILIVSLLACAACVGLGGYLAPRRGPVPALALASLGTMLLVGGLVHAAEQLPRRQAERALVAAAAKRLGPDTAFYCVDEYLQTIPFYLHRPCTLVGYRGELDYGLRHAPERWVADLDEFARRWRADGDALALVRPSSYAELRRMGLPMRVIYTAPTLVVVVRQ